MKSGDYTNYCCEKRRQWRKLPCNCLLLDKLLRELEQGKDNFIKAPTWVCPRCLYNDITIFTETPKENRHGDKVSYTGWCFICGVQSHEEGL